MVRVVDERLMTNDGKRLITAYGKSTDDKPTRDVITGSLFVEVDTGKVYFFDEDSGTWLDSGGGNA